MGCELRRGDIGVMRQARRALLTAGLVAGSLGIAALLELELGTLVGDRIASGHVPADQRVVVVDLSERGVDDASVDQFLDGFTSSAITRIAVDSGARVVGFVEFDSLTFNDGGSGRGMVIGSEAMQDFAVLPLIDVAVRHPRSSLPLLVSYRVDQLSSEAAGIGVSLTVEEDAARLMLAFAAVADVENGAVVRVPEAKIAEASGTADRVVAALSIRMLELAGGDPIVRVSSAQLQIGDRTVPLERGRLRIRWSRDLDSLDDEAVLPAAQLLDRSLDRSILRDSIVLVGSLDPADTNFVDTPIGALPPALVHANALNTVISRAWMRPAPIEISVLVAVVGAVGLALMRRASSRLIAACAFALGWSISVRWLADRGTLLPAVFVPAAVLCCAALFEAYRQIRNLLERRRLRELFSQYVSPGVAEQLVSSRFAARVEEGERRTITALFCDLRDFTPLAASLDPSMVRRLLNSYYEAMGTVAFAAGGTVMQYTGDEIFIAFGTPLPMDDHASAAIACARAMFERLDGLNRELVEDDLPPIEFGIGIHTGDVVAAHVGSSFRMQYSVIGDSVNVASRHVKAAAAGEIVISESTVSCATSPSDGEFVTLRLKGVEGERVACVITARPGDAPFGSRRR